VSIASCSKAGANSANGRLAPAFDTRRAIDQIAGQIISRKPLLDQHDLSTRHKARQDFRFEGVMQLRHLGHGVRFFVAGNGIVDDDPFPAPAKHRTGRADAEELAPVRRAERGRCRQCG